jgi:hypothetical protein
MHRISKDGFALHSLLYNRQNTLLDVGRSMFDARRSFFSKQLVLSCIAKVSFSIRLAVFWPAAGLNPGHGAMPSF